VDWDGFVFMLFCTALGCWIVLATGACGRGSTFHCITVVFALSIISIAQFGFSNLTIRLQLPVVQEKGLFSVTLVASLHVK